MRSLTQKEIIQSVKEDRFTVMFFNRTTGKRIGTISHCDPLRAFAETALRLPNLDMAVIVAPSDIFEISLESDTDISLEKAVEMTKGFRFIDYKKFL